MEEDTSEKLYPMMRKNIPFLLKNHR